MTISTNDQAAAIRKSKTKKIIISVLLGIIAPIILALIMNQAIANEIYPEGPPLALNASPPVYAPVLAAQSAPPPAPVTNTAPPSAPAATIEVSSAPPAPVDASSAAIFGVLVSDEAGQDGYVTTNKPVIPTGASNIYVTTQIMNAVPGIKVSAAITGLTNTVATKTLSLTTFKPGNIMKGFSFSNHDKTWPAGEYRVNVTLSNGQAKQVIFDVR